MATKRNSPVRDPPNDDLAADEAELIDRLVASASGLPRVCLFKRCRRRKRCLGDLVSGRLPCVRQHPGLARMRFQSALKVLGWSNRDNAGNPVVGQSAAGNGQS